MIIVVYFLNHLDVYYWEFNKLTLNVSILLQSLALGMLSGIIMFILIMKTVFILSATEYKYEYKSVGEVYDTGSGLCYFVDDSTSRNKVELEDVLIVEDYLHKWDSCILIQRREVITDSVFWGFSNSHIDANIVIKGKGVKLKTFRD